MTAKKELTAEEHNIALTVEIKELETKVKALKQKFKPITGTVQATLQECNRLNKTKK